MSVTSDPNTPESPATSPRRQTPNFIVICIQPLIIAIHSAFGHWNSNFILRSTGWTNLPEDGASEESDAHTAVQQQGRCVSSRRQTVLHISGRRPPSVSYHRSKDKSVAHSGPDHTRRGAGVTEPN